MVYLVYSLWIGVVYMIKCNGKVIQLNKKNKSNLVNLLNVASDNPLISHFRRNSNNCIVRFIPKSILDDFNDRIIIQNNLVNDIGISDVYGQLFMNSLWDNFTYNPISYSDFSHIYRSDTMGHYNFRSQSLLFDLLDPIGVVQPAVYNDICIHSYIKVSDLDLLSNFISYSEDYYMVITHGYLLYENYNKLLNSKELNNDYFKLLENLIPFETYKRDYIYRMATPLHIYNGVTHIDFLRLSFIGLMGYLNTFENGINPFIVDNNPTRLISVLKGEYSSKINKNPKLLETKKSLRLLVPNGDVVSKIVLDIQKDGVSINSISDFIYPDIKKISELPHDISENFIHDNLSSLPTLSYGLSNILDLILRDYTRSCCDGKEIERGIIHLDLNDLLDICNPIINANMNYNLNEGYCFYNDWKCLNLLDIVEILCNNAPISFNQFKSELINIPKNEQFKYKSIPFTLLFAFILYRLTGRLSGFYKEKLLKVHPNVEISTNGLYNYSSTIDNYIKTGIIELENKCPKNVQKIEKEYDWSDLEGFSLSGNDLIQTFESEAESFVKQEIGFDREALNKFGDFGDLNFHDNVEKAKELTSEDLEKKDLLSVFGTADEGVEVSEDIEDMSNEDLVEFFGSSKGLNLNYPTNFDDVVKAPDLSKEYPTNPHREFGEDEPILTHHPLKDFDTGLDEFFKTSPYFDNNGDLRSILLDDIFNPGLDYSVAQIKSLIAREGINIDIFRKELLTRVLKKINSDEGIFEVYTALKNLF